MAARKNKFTFILFIWPATLVAAFFVGKLTQMNDPTAAYQATLAASAEQSEAKANELKKLRKEIAANENTAMVEGVLDPLLQIRSALSQSDSLKRMSMLTDAFSRLTKDNILEGVALLDSIEDGRLKQQMKTILLNTWGKLDGPAAMDYVLNQAPENDQGRGRGGPGRGGPGGSDRFGGSGLRDTMTVMSGWAETDPKAAVLWAADNGTDDNGRNTMMMAAMQGWANNDIQGALNYAMTQTTDSTNPQDGRGGRAGGGIENFLISRFVNDDPQAATQWALSQSDPNVRAEAVASTARSFANSDPEKAALWAQSISDPVAQAEALKGTASGWAREDPKAAMDWALTLNDPATSSQATKSALSTWAREDPYSASDYVINMEAGADKDVAAATLTQNLVRQDPEMALLWAGSITDSNLQMNTLAPITNGWMQKDPAKATEWIQSSSLSEETKQALLNPTQPAQPRKTKQPRQP